MTPEKRAELFRRNHPADVSSAMADELVRAMYAERKALLIEVHNLVAMHGAKSADGKAATLPILRKLREIMKAEPRPSKRPR